MSIAEPRTDPSDDKSGVSPSGPGLKPQPSDTPTARVAQDVTRESNKPRNTPPDNPFGDVKTQSNE
jgi:hypothetical protein